MDIALNTNRQAALTYWQNLKDLRQDVKLELIALLASSLTNTPKKEETKEWANKYCGAWKDDKSAEELTKEIRESRYNGTREILSLD